MNLNWDFHKPEPSNAAAFEHQLYTGSDWRVIRVNLLEHSQLLLRELLPVNGDKPAPYRIMV